MDTYELSIVLITDNYPNFFVYLFQILSIFFSLRKNHDIFILAI